MWIRTLICVLFCRYLSIVVVIGPKSCLNPHFVITQLLAKQTLLFCQKSRYSRMWITPLIFLLVCLYLSIGVIIGPKSCLNPHSRKTKILAKVMLFQNVDYNTYLCIILPTLINRWCTWLPSTSVWPQGSSQVVFGLTIQGCSHVLGSPRERQWIPLWDGRPQGHGGQDPTR
jgi:hypothetical protein